MTPIFSTKIIVDTLKARVTDLFNYATILKDAAYGNITAKIGNSTFHTNTNFNGSADIVIGGNTFVDFDLPISDGKILNGTYSFTEDVEIVNEVLYKPAITSGFFTATPPAASPTPFASILAPAIPTSQGQFETDILALIAAYVDKKVSFYNSSHVRIGQSNLTGVDITGATTLLFDSLTFATQADIAYWRIEGTNHYLTTTSYTYTGCPVVTPKLQVIVDCYRSQISITDCTVYPATSSLTRTITAQYPTLANGNHVLPTVTTSNASLELGPNIWTGGYIVDLSSVLNWQNTDGLYVQQTVTAQVNKNVQCDAGLCDLSDCISKFRKKYMAAVQNGSKDMTSIFQDNFIITLFLQGIDLAVKCQDTTKASAITSALRVFMSDGSASEGCDCGCEGSDSTDSTPHEIFPLFSSESENVLVATAITTEVVVADTSITINLMGRTFKLLAKEII